MARSLIVRLLLLLGLIWPSLATAHLTASTEIALTVGRDNLSGRITVPESEWRYAYGLERDDAALVAARLSIRSLQGEVWKISGVSVTRETSQGVPDLVADFTARPPQGAPLRSFRLAYRGVIEKVSGHAVLVVARNDFAGGVLEGEPHLLGGMQMGREEIVVTLGEASLWNGFRAALALGMRHISEGPDHLMFLLTLLLPAPLIAAGGRWEGFAGRRETIRHLLLIVTAFTIGHSLTLIGGAAFGWSLPVRPVEVGIAVSILISAMHAARPLFPGREAWVAGSFGLIHGLAFATVIGAFALPVDEKAVAIFGFNLGIELVQLALVAAVLPVLLIVAQRELYCAVRMLGSLASGVAAMIWIVQRI